MHIELCRTGGKPLPLQISEALGQRIASGLLQPGMRLPSVRKLAVSLGVSQVTVSKAYADLERRGRIVRRHGLGCFVSPAKDGNREDEEYRTGKAGRAGNWKHDAGKKNGITGRASAAEARFRA